MRIHKYKLDFLDRQEVELPLGAQVLSVQLQDGKACLWAMIDEFVSETDTLVLRMFHTGEPAERCSRHLATLQHEVNGEPWVVHVFEE